MWPGGLGAWHGRPAGGIRAGANTGKMPLPPRAIDYAETRRDRTGPVGGLARGAKRATVAGVMSATEIIELIEKLPAVEQEQVRVFLETKTPKPGEVREIRYISDEKFSENLPKIFEQHHDLLRRLSL